MDEHFHSYSAIWKLFNLHVLFSLRFLKRNSYIIRERFLTCRSRIKVQYTIIEIKLFFHQEMANFHLAIYIGWYQLKNNKSFKIQYLKFWKLMTPWVDLSESPVKVNTWTRLYCVTSIENLCNLLCTFIDIQMIKTNKLRFTVWRSIFSLIRQSENFSIFISYLA